MSFLCQICGKSFTEKRSLTRHEKSHNQSTTIYSCSICGKEFNRPDYRKRHEKTHSDAFNCAVCGQFFNRKDSMLRHKLIHDQPNKKPRINMKRPASPEPGPSHVQSPPKRQRTASPEPSQSPAKRQRTASEQPDILPEDPDTRTLYLRHWDDIRTRENTGNRVQDRYNYTLHDLNITQFGEMVRSIYLQQRTAFVINMSFGFILRNHETGELRFYHPSQNNARFLDVPHRIHSEDDLERFIQDITRHDLLEHIRQQRPDTKWVVHLITNVTFYINKITNHPIGAHCFLPNFIANNSGVNALVAGSNGPYNDQLCFFRCLAVHRGAQVKDVETPAKTYFQQYLRHKGMYAAEFKGVTLDELSSLEQLFKLSIHVYELKEEEDNVNAELVRRSPHKYKDAMFLNLYCYHFSYINDMKKYSSSYSCRKCGKLWKSCWNLHRHEQTCQGNVRYFHPGGVYETNKSVFEELEDEGIHIPEDLRFYPFRATYDIETMLQPSDKPNTNKLEWVNQHILLSISVASNIPDYTEPRCFVTDGNSGDVVKSCITYLHEMSDEAYNQLRDQYFNVFCQINTKVTKDLKNIADPDEKEREKKTHYLYQLGQKLERHLHELPVIGFNSGKYDLNAMKIDFFGHLADQNKIKYTVKRNNNFMCVKTDKLKFLDVTNYLAPGFSYAQFLKAYGCAEEKGFFPYEWMDTPEKLKHTELPPHAAFHSSLKNENITSEEYEYCRHIFNENNMTTMKDFLIWYNNKDVVPMLEALAKMVDFYKQRHIDMFKDGISVPGLTLKYMFQGLPNHFTLPNEDHKDVYRLFKDNIVGGPSIVFHRYHEAEKTFIRPTEYTDPKLCKNVIGYDANALYLWCVMQDMPTGHFVIRKEEDNFKRQTPRRYEAKAVKWLEWEARRSGLSIRHQANGSEKLIGRKRLPVDGFCKENNTVYEFQGCIWHGHRCWMTKNCNGVNPVNGKSLNGLLEEAKEKIQYIKEEGYNVIEMWECQWHQKIRQDPALQQFIESMKRPCDNYVTMTKEQIMAAVLSDKLFGAIEVDIHVPDHLKPKFSEMPPIFKNTEISLDDIGEHMKQYAEEREMMKQPRKSLIGSMFGEKIMVITPLLKWYISHGLEVTRIYQVVEYTPSKCFEEFGNIISDARRAGDADPDKKIIAETHKLDGNSSYGKTVTNKEKHSDVIFCNSKTVNKYLVDPFFRRCNQLNDDTFEIEMSKRVIHLDLPLQIGCFVYQYAKLRMLEFYFDFMDTFIDRKDFQYCSMDTDSAYMALSSTTIEDIIKPALRHRYEEEKYLWFPREDTPEHAAFDRRTPGLFKIEYEGEGIIALCSKTYYCFGPNNKFSCKGINKRTNTITKDTYMDVLLSKKSGSGTNRGFRSINNSVFTYLQERAGFSYLYAKRKVLEDGISTSFLNI